MKNIWFIYIFLFGLLFSSACGENGLCSCGTSCSVAVNGELSCHLSPSALAARKAQFQDMFFSKAEKIEELETGYLFVFKDNGKLNEDLFEFIIEEKKCCPFFQYDIKILPYQEGLHLTISGDEKVKDFLKTLIENDDVKIKIVKES